MASLGIFGSLGRMGKMIKTLAVNHPEINEIIEFKSSENIITFIEKSDFLVDFSSSEGCLFLIQALLKNQPKPILIGTTNLSPECNKYIEDLSKKTAVMLAPNVSIGANLQALLSEKAAQILGNNYKVQITDIHHALKKDAPSGTALMLCEHVNKGFSNDKAKGEIEISSIREGNAVGEHIVNFIGGDDSLTITHKIENRALLAHGAITSILWLRNQIAGKYSMQNMLKF